MYNEHDRPSNTRMIVTVASVIGAIAIVIAVSAVLAGAFFNRASVVSDQPLSTATVQPVASATAHTDTSSQPAATPPSQPSPAPASVVPTVPAPSTTTAATTPKTGWVVCIDAGHQRNGTPDLKQEPIGPGASTTKDRVEGGTQGIYTKVPESNVNLAVALKLRTVLESRGVKVVMVRTTENVDIPNSERAKIANNAHADLFMRLHCDSDAAPGFLMLIPAASDVWTKPIYAQSKIAGEDVLKAALAATGAHNRGTEPRSDLTGFNYAKVPAILAEMGVMTNKAEDIKLNTASYQQKLADGMANGIIEYLRSR